MAHWRWPCRQLSLELGLLLAAFQQPAIGREVGAESHPRPACLPGSMSLTQHRGAQQLTRAPRCWSSAPQPPPRGLPTARDSLVFHVIKKNPRPPSTALPPRHGPRPPGSGPAKKLRARLPGHARERRTAVPTGAQAGGPQSSSESCRSRISSSGPWASRLSSRSSRPASVSALPSSESLTSWLLEPPSSASSSSSSSASFSSTLCQAPGDPGIPGYQGEEPTGVGPPANAHWGS